MAHKTNSRALVVCPKSLKERWQADFPESYVVTKEELRRAHSKIPYFNVVIIDEIHHFSGNSQMTKALGAYIKTRNPNFIFGGTATPFRSTPWNVYYLAKLLGAQWPYNKFRETFFRIQYFGSRAVWVPKDDATTREKLITMLSRFCDIVSHEQAGLPPEDVFKEEKFEFTAEQKKEIKKIKDKETNPVVLYGKEHQIAQGFLKGTEFEETRHFKNEKIPRILEIAGENPNLLVFCRYTAQIEALADALHKKGHAVHTLTGATKDRTIPTEGILIAQTALGEGWEAPHFTTIVFASLPWSYAHMQQCIGRASRINIPRRRTYIILTTKNSLDEKVKASLDKKEDFYIELLGNTSSVMVE